MWSLTADRQEWLSSRECLRPVLAVEILLLQVLPRCCQDRCFTVVWNDSSTSMFAHSYCPAGWRAVSESGPRICVDLVLGMCSVMLTTDLCICISTVRRLHFKAFHGTLCVEIFYCMVIFPGSTGGWFGPELLWQLVNILTCHSFYGKFSQMEQPGLASSVIAAFSW